MPTIRNKRNSGPKCSFCDSRQTRGAKLISGPQNVYICSDCIRLSRELLKNSSEMNTVGGNNQLPHPQANQSALGSVCNRTASGKKTTLRRRLQSLPTLGKCTADQREV